MTDWLTAVFALTHVAVAQPPSEGSGLQFEPDSSAEITECVTYSAPILSDRSQMLAGLDTDPSEQAVLELYPLQGVDTQGLAALARTGLVGTRYFHDVLLASVRSDLERHPEPSLTGILTEESINRWWIHQSETVRENIGKQIAHTILRDFSEAQSQSLGRKSAFARAVRTGAARLHITPAEFILTLNILNHYRLSHFLDFANDLQNLLTQRPQLVMQRMAIGQKSISAPRPAVEPYLEPPKFQQQLAEMPSTLQDAWLAENYWQLTPDEIQVALKNRQLCAGTVQILLDWKNLQHTHHQTEARGYVLEARLRYLQNLRAERKKSPHEPAKNASAHLLRSFTLPKDIRPTELRKYIRGFIQAEKGRLNAEVFTNRLVPEILAELYGIRMRDPNLPPQVFVEAVNEISHQALQFGQKMSEAEKIEIIKRTYAIVQLKPKFELSSVASQKILAMYQYLDVFSVVGCAVIGGCLGFAIPWALGFSERQAELLTQPGMLLGIMGGIVAPRVADQANNLYRYAKYRATRLDYALKRHLHLLKEKPWGADLSGLPDSFDTDADLDHAITQLESVLAEQTRYLKALEHQLEHPETKTENYIPNDRPSGPPR